MDKKVLIMGKDHTKTYAKKIELYDRIWFGENLAYDYLGANSEDKSFTNLNTINIDYDIILERSITCKNEFVIIKLFDKMREDIKE